jgi:hypothetical protein
MTDYALEAAAGAMFTRRLDDGRLQLVATRLVRPATFNSLRVSPTYPANDRSAKQMAARAHETVKEIEAWRSWAKDHPDAVDCVPLVGQVEVDVYHWRLNHAAKPDTGSPYVAAKALLDGLVDAKRLPAGDGPDVVRRETFHAYEARGVDALRVVVTTIPGTEQTVLEL